MLITLVGLAVLLPTWISLTAVIGGWLCMRAQVLEEATYLSKTYGESSQRYAQRVGRFVPGVGLLK